MSLRPVAFAALLAAPTAASAWDPTLPQHPTTYVVDDSLTEGAAANFLDLYVDPSQLQAQLKPTRSFVPPKVRPKVVIARDRFVISDKILFETGKANIDARSGELLDTIAAALQEHTSITLVTVEGHTDDVGQDEANLILSNERAAAVLAALVQRGVDPARLLSIGKGETEPRIQATTDDARQANRRVEFLISARAEAEVAAGEEQEAVEAEDAAVVRKRLREERARLMNLPKTGDLPIRNETTSYADVTIGDLEVGRIGPLKVGIIEDVPAGFYTVQLKLQNGFVKTFEARTESVERPPIPGNAAAAATLEEGVVYSWHDDPSAGHVPPKTARRVRKGAKERMRTAQPDGASEE